jgi:hypothetical protein
VFCRTVTAAVDVLPDCDTVSTYVPGTDTCGFGRSDLKPPGPDHAYATPGVGDAPRSVTVFERQVISPDTVADAPGEGTSAARTRILPHSDNRPAITSNPGIVLPEHESLFIMKRFVLLSD